MNTHFYMILFLLCLVMPKNYGMDHNGLCDTKGQMEKTEEAKNGSAIEFETPESARNASLTLRCAEHALAGGASGFVFGSTIKDSEIFYFAAACLSNLTCVTYQAIRGYNDPGFPHDINHPVHRKRSIATYASTALGFIGGVIAQRYLYTSREENHLVDLREGL